MLPIAHWPIRVQGIEEDMSSNILSFINFEPLKFYWTYFLALQTTTPKIPSMRLMSLDHEPKMRCCAINSNYGPWWDYIVMSFGPWALTTFLWIWTLLGFKIDYPKIHDSVDVVQVAIEIKPCGVKNLSSTFSPPSAWACFARACLTKACFCKGMHEWRCFLKEIGHCWTNRVM